MMTFYTKDYADSLQKTSRKYVGISLTAALSALAVCIILCFFVTTRSAKALFYTVSVLSIGVGWIFILYLWPKCRACRAEYTHCENILKKTEVEYHTGRISVSPSAIHIPGSIRVKDVRLQNGQEELRLHVNAAFSLPPEGSAVRLTCVGKYVTAYEVTDDA